MVGAQFGPYTIVAPLGAGGMGEVYRARDTRLDRTVAIKILSGPGNPKRAQRFAREARAVSKVNHPHICTLYDIGDQDGVQFIVMEYLDGETLAQRLRRGTLPLNQLLRYAIEIADALAHAHREGVVHRDLKPANIMLTGSGAKLLDFGIAALHAPGLMGADQRTGSLGEHAETLTEEGTILGTLQYMAPEQLEARPTDARADIFAFGAIVYEMATGQQAFKGTSRASVIAAVLERDPELLATPGTPGDEALSGTGGGRPALPWMLNQIVARCLAKNPDDRFQTAADLEQALKWMAESGAQAGGRVLRSESRGWRSPRVAWIAVAVVAIVAAVAMALNFTGSPPPAPSALRPVRFVVSPPPNAAFSQSSASFALSPDGRALAFTAATGQSGVALWLQSLDSLEARTVPGTEGAEQIFWSPDSRAIAFGDSSAQLKGKTVDLEKGLLRSLASVEIRTPGAWSAEHGIIATHKGVIHQIRVDGGPPAPLTALNASAGETAHNFPSFLPGGRSFVFLARSTQPEHDSVVYLGSLGSSDRVRLFNSDSQVVYAAPGYLLYMLGNTLLARSFDPGSLRVIGEPVPIAEQVERTIGSRRGAFTVSQTGVLAFRQHNQTQLVWFDRGGRRIQTIGPPGHYGNPALSPDGKRVAVAGLDLKTGGWDIWLIEVGRGAISRFTSDPAVDDTPVWSPDGSRIAFKSDRSGQVAFYHKSSSGAGGEEVLHAAEGEFQTPYAWLGDRTFLYGMRVRRADKTPPGTGLWLTSITGRQKPVPLVQNQFVNQFSAVSADRRWLAYSSNESGRFEVYAMPFPSGRGKWPVSVNGGTEPAWRADGKELFYLAPDRSLMAVPLEGGSSPQLGPPTRLFEAPVSSFVYTVYTRNQYVVTGDGQRFLINQPVGGPSLSTITVVVDWTASLKGRSG